MSQLISANTMDLSYIFIFLMILPSTLSGVMDFGTECDFINSGRRLSTNKTLAATPITNFYSGKSVFITGGTGFLGSIIIGKLLTTCPVKRVYVLIKTKNGKSIQERFTELINSKVFDEVRKNNNSALENLVPISGDIRDKQLGLSEEDTATLCTEVSLVLHTAANINMDSDLRDAVEVNTKSTAELVTFCKRMQQLRVFLYVSTAYSNCQRTVIDEKVYEPSTSIEAIYDILENDDKGKILFNQYNALMESRPNTYTFSKSLAEKIVEEGFQGILPSVIIRPSIIVSSIKYPEPGWTSSWSAPNRLIQSVAAGYLRCMYSDTDALVDIVPVDQVANLVIASVWDADKHRVNKVKVFNCCSTLRNPITVAGYMRCGAHVMRKYSWTASFTRFLVMPKNRFVFNILWFFLQVIPAYVQDTLSWLMGQKQRAARINASLARALAVCDFFAITEFTFIDHNTRRLLKDMDTEDQKLFDFDFSAFEWENFLEIYVHGLLRYLTR